ncbi:unnamed protein product [Blepharisma stoltei]|uniref:Uncharacterized protein n=1 Tax=Blepharisma stoltei TaxID=1481888 RepID=A0AAU9JUG8_9CILI|nr:unnamed protein product [Blepharisma stoltei]
MNLNLEELDSELNMDREYLIGKLKSRSEEQLNNKIPKEFLNFIDSLITYLGEGASDSLNEMDNIIRNWNIDFDIRSESYKDNDYWGKVLIYYCWNSKHFISLKEFWEMKVKEKNEQEAKEVAEQETKQEINEETKEELKEEIKKEIKEIDIVQEDFSSLNPIDFFSDINILYLPEEHKGYKENQVSQKGKKWTQKEIDLQVQLLSEFKNCCVLNILFDIKISNQVKKWLISQLSNLFSLSINYSNENANFIIKTIPFVMQLISKPIVKANNNQKKNFDTLARSRAVKESLDNIGLKINFFS